MPKLLYRLQEIDLRIQCIAQNIEANPYALVSSLQEEMDKLDEEQQLEGERLSEIQVLLKDKQLQLEGLKEKEKERKKRLESSSRGAKYIEAVLGDLSRQVLAVESDIRRLQQEQNSIQRKLEDYKQEKEKRKAYLQSFVEEQTRKREELSAELEKLQKEREELVRVISPRLTQMYDRKKALKKGVAVARMETENNSCSECSFILPLLTVMQVQKDGLTECPNCGRILVCL